MVSKVLLFVGSTIPFVWGVAHLFPTKSVVKGFSPISEANAQIITMEWITEGVKNIAGLLDGAHVVIQATAQ